jgi:hypothetical protein
MFRALHLARYDNHDPTRVSDPITALAITTTPSIPNTTIRKINQSRPTASQFIELGVKAE